MTSGRVRKGEGEREKKKVIINPSINVISMIAFDLIPPTKIEQIKRHTLADAHAQSLTRARCVSASISVI